MYSGSIMHTLPYKEFLFYKFIIQGLETLE